MNADLSRCSLPHTTGWGKLPRVRSLALHLLRPICRLRGNVRPGVYRNVVGFPFIFTSFPLGCVRKHTEGGTGGRLGGAHMGVGCLSPVEGHDKSFEDNLVPSVPADCK